MICEVIVTNEIYFQVTYGIIFIIYAGNLSYFKYNYMYGLGLACCTIIFVLPFILFAKVVSLDCEFCLFYNDLYFVSPAEHHIVCSHRQLWCNIW